VPGISGLLREGNDDAEGLSGSELAAIHLVEAWPGGNPKIQDSSAGLFIKVGTSLTVGAIEKVVRIGPVYVSSDNTRPDERELNNQDIDYTGSLWYRLTDNDFFINTTGEHNVEAWKSLVTRYNRTVATPYTVGGVKAGSTFNNLTLPAVFDRIFYPASAVSIASFNIDPDPMGGLDNYTVDIGTSIVPPGGLNLRTLSITTEGFSAISNVDYLAGTVKNNLNPINVVHPNGTYSGLGAGRTFTYTQEQSLYYITPTAYYWAVLVTDLQGETSIGPYRSITWAYKSFFFTDSNPNVTDIWGTYQTKTPTSLPCVVTDEAIPTLDYSRITKAAKLDTLTAEYLYVALPIGREAGAVFYDDGYTPYTSFSENFGAGVAMNAPYTTTVSINNITVRYLVYRSTVATKAAYSINLY
jgi:hypothetical protein